MGEISIYVDGATGNGQRSGVAAVARSHHGHFLGWMSRQMPQMTNNEAEYEAVLLGLRLAKALAVDSVEIVTDSEVVVQQMLGHSRVHSKGLRVLHRATVQAVRSFAWVNFRHVRREENRLADALAAEAMEGREVVMHTTGSRMQRLYRLLPASLRRTGGQGVAES